MRLSTSLSWLALSTATIASAAMVNVPTLFSCEPATISVLAKGNYTIEARDLDSHRLVFRARVKKNVSLVNWNAVDLAPNATAVFTVTDQVGVGPTQTAQVTAQALIEPNPSGNTTCLPTEQRDRKDNDHNGPTKAQKNMVPTIIGIVLGAFLLLVLLLVGGMMYRRKKERSQKVDDDSVDLNHGYAAQTNVPAGSSYMARLVPGLVLQDARPLPRDPVLESEQANYSSTRRGTYMNRNGTAAPEGNASGGYELPSYGQSQRFSKTGAAANQHTKNNSSSFYRRDGLPAADSNRPYGAPHQPSAYGYAPQQQQQEQYGANANPFASQHDLSYASPPHQPQQQHEQRVYQQKEWETSQASFLTKKSSH